MDLLDRLFGWGKYSQNKDILNVQYNNHLKEIQEWEEQGVKWREEELDAFEELERNLYVGEEEKWLEESAFRSKETYGPPTVRTLNGDERITLYAKVLEGNQSAKELLEMRYEIDELLFSIAVTHMSIKKIDKSPESIYDGED